MSANSEFDNLDNLLGRLHLTPKRLRTWAQQERKQGREWKRGTLEQSCNQKYLLEDKKVIASGDIPLGDFPLTSTDEDRQLFDAWNFVNELYDELKQAGENEVHKLKKLRRKVAGPLMLGLNLIMAIAAARFRVMSKELSEQEFADSLDNGEAHDYAEAANRAWKRFDVWSKRNESIQELMNGFHHLGDLKIVKYADYQAKMLWDLQMQYEAEGRDEDVRIGVRESRRGFMAGFEFLEKYFKLLVAYAEVGSQAVQEQVDVAFFKWKLEHQIPRRYESLRSKG